MYSTFSKGDNELTVKAPARASRSKWSKMEAFVEQCAAMQRRMGELTNEAAEVEPIVDALVKSHAEFEVRKDRYKKALAK